MVEPDVEAGENLIEVLTQNGLKPRTALWLRVDGNWRLVLHIGKFEKLTPSLAYRQIQRVLDDAEARGLRLPPLREITLVKRDEPILIALRRVFGRTPPDPGSKVDIRIKDSSVDGQWIEDAYVFRL